MKKRAMSFNLNVIISLIAIILLALILFIIFKKNIFDGVFGRI